MSQKVRWGILSTANIGRARVIPAIKESSNGEVVAVASRTMERARQFAADNDIPTAHGSYEELLANPNVDAIYNPLPNSQHAKWSIRSAEAGKPMLCEKPLASNAAEAQQMVDAFKSRDLLFAEAFMYRFHPQTERVLQLIAEDAIGDVHLIQARFTFPIQDEANIRLSAELAGGAVLDVGTYCINIMRLITGEEPDAVKAMARFGETSGVDEKLAGLLSFPSGIIGHFDCGLRSFRSHQCEITGSSGRILIDEAFVTSPDRGSMIRVWQGDLYAEVHVPASNHYTLMVEDFADALLNNRPPRFDPQDGVANMQVIDRLLESARQ